MNIEITEPKFTDYQKSILNAEERFTITEAATKTGKTFSHLYWLFKQAHHHKIHSNHWWVAPVYSQSEMAFQRMARAVGKNPSYKINLSKLLITTPINTYIHFKSAEKPDNLYGDDVYSAVFDEFTRAREEAWFALRSTLTATNGKCKFIGNVKGKKNWGYKLGLRAKNGEPNFKYFKITAYDAVREGILKAEEIEQAKRDLPENVFNELYLASPTEDGSNPFGYRYIDACIGQLSTKPVKSYGIDLAKSVDWTVIIGLDDDGAVAFVDRFQHDWQTTKRIIKDTIQHKPALIDSTGVGDGIVEDLQKVCPNVEGFKFTSNSKQQLMEGLSLAIQQRLISFPEGIIPDELKSFEYEYTRTGVRYNAPSGFTDDCVCALSLAWKHKNMGVGQYSIS